MKSWLKLSEDKLRKLNKLREVLVIWITEVNKYSQLHGVNFSAETEI